ncbi:MAG TPA: ATP-binding cassette domain-containing protein [Polyangiaceae bacterium]|nr:ATP-binding cassette domain-containing protein [Polyangiaceae bacterium]
MKILSGIYPHGSYGGDVVLDGKVQRFSGIRDSERARIAIIFQELALVKQMSIAENLFLGSERLKAPGVIDWNRTYEATAKALQAVGLKRSPADRVIDLGVGEQQLVEIAKALSKDANLLILDEPTAALTETETETLLQILGRLRENGVTCIYISHRLGEVMRIADRITVIRDGRTVSTDDKADMSQTRMIQKMVGRDLGDLFPWKARTPGEPVLEVKGWTVADPVTDAIRVNDVSFTVRKGETVGISGLMGAGRTELVMSLFGAWGKRRAGEVWLDGRKLAIEGPRDAIAAGLALVSEDRKRYGLVLDMDVKQNSTLASLHRLSRWSVIDKNREIRVSEEYVRDLRTKTPSVEQKVRNLSGGNQQKVVLAKWLLTHPRVLFLDEPTRGIDVGAKVEIYNIMNALVDQGVCVVMISSELPEVLGMSDRVLVVHEGRLTGELARGEATEQRVMYHATGGT